MKVSVWSIRMCQWMVSMWKLVCDGQYLKVKVGRSVVYESLGCR